MAAAPVFTLESRQENIGQLRRLEFDVLILGGGINGAGIARDLALRAWHTRAPFKIALIEKNHYASGTSGRNSQLIHGGLRYLKNFEFHLVREALRERATLLAIAPHLVKPQRFLIPAYGAFSRFYYGAGLSLYDLLAGSRGIGRHRILSRGAVSGLEPDLATAGLDGGVTFFDCVVNSARLVLENVFDAARYGAAIANYVDAVEISSAGVIARDSLHDETFRIRARKIVDATGAWSADEGLRLVRGSHLIFPRLTASDAAIANFDGKGRVVFVIPWGERRELSLVGTTDVDHSGSPDDVHISPEEIDYLTGIVSGLFPRRPIPRPVSSYSALRPLIRDESASPTKTSREHRIWETQDGILHVAGGKYTTYRAMSEEAVDRIAPGKCLTAEMPLPQTAFSGGAEEAVRYEMARHLGDLLRVSTYRGYERTLTPDALAPLAREMGALLGWTISQIEREIESLIATEQELKCTE